MSAIRVDADNTRFLCMLIFIMQYYFVNFAFLEAPRFTKIFL